MDLTARAIPRHHERQQVLSPANGPWWGLRDLDGLLVDASVGPLPLGLILLSVPNALLLPGTPVLGRVAVAGPVVQRIFLVGELLGKVPGVVPQGKVGARRPGAGAATALLVGVVEQTGGVVSVVVVVPIGRGGEGSERYGNV